MRTCLFVLLALPLLSFRPAAQGLERVAPRGEGQSLPDLFARDFQRDEWKNALSVTDLDLRERNLDALLQRARLDPVARAFLEELARDPAGGELAWTARLALRELGRARFAPRTTLLGPDPLGTAGRMDEMLKQMLGNGLARPGQQRGGGLALEGPGGRLRLEEGEGFARIEVLMGSGPEAERRVFEGESLEALLRAHPELEGMLGGLAGGAAPGAGGRARIDGPTFATPLGPAQRSLPLTTDKLGVIVTPLGAAGARELGLEEGLGLEVTRVLAESYAGLLGVAAGDVLLELDGVPLRTPEDIERVMKSRAKDAELALTWIDALAQRQKRTWKAPAPR